ncbi:oligopeptide/dipeptide ABC transporter ATP-binding protein, partial [Salmonella enterica]|uniref:oligopeptide/dipeptide ABC transporter ATP-binding protein n=1 Tax=Salmonella enterica TaxID=28901 RepID=UPI003D29BA3C
MIGNARHPYSAELLAATPQHAARAEDLHVIRGLLPDLSGPLPPCRFAMRCARHQPDCDAAPVSLTEHAPRHLVACR